MADTPSDPHRYPTPSLSASPTTTRSKRPFHQTTLSSASTSSASSSTFMSSSTALEQPNQNIPDEETGSARKRARNSVSATNNTERSMEGGAAAAAAIRRNSVDDDRRSFVAAYESSPERPSAVNTTTGDLAVPPRPRSSIPPAAPASSSSSPPPTGPPSSTASSNTSMSIPSRYMSLDGVWPPVESSNRISIPPTRTAEEEEDDRMETDSPDVDTEDHVADRERGRPTVTSSVPAPLFHPSSSPEPSSSSSSTAGPGESRNSRSWRTSPPAPTRPATRASPVPPSDAFWVFSTDNRGMMSVPSISYPSIAPTPSAILSYSNPRRSTPTSTSTASTAQPRPLSLTSLNNNGPYQPLPYEFRSASSARRFSETIDPLRRSPSPPLPSPPLPVPSRSARRRQLIQEMVHGRYHRTGSAMASGNNSLAPLLSTSTTNADADAASRNGPRLPPVIASFPITESDSSDEELFDRELLGGLSTTRPFSRATTSRPTTNQTSAIPGITTSFVSAGSYPFSSTASSATASSERGTSELRTSSQTPPPLVVADLTGGRAGGNNSTSTGVSSPMVYPASAVTGGVRTPFFRFTASPVPASRRHHADDDIALEQDISPPIFAGPDDHVHDHQHDHGDDLEHRADLSLVEAPPPPTPGPSAPSSSDPQANQMLEMNEMIGFHHRVETLGRLAENIGRNMPSTRRTMQSAEIELLDLYPNQSWRIAHEMDNPEFDARRVRLRTAYSNMVRTVREARSAFLDAERNLARSRRELEAAMRAEGLEQASSRAAEDMAEARATAAAAGSRLSARPVSLYEEYLHFLGQDDAQRAIGAQERIIRNRLRLLEEERAGRADETGASSATATTGASGPVAVNGSGAGLTSRARRTMQQRSASSAPSSATPSVTVEEVPERTSQVRERAADGWSPLQISPFVPPPSPPRPVSRVRPASRYSSVDPYWIRDDSVESIDEFDVGDYEYFRNMTWNRRQRPGQRDAEETRESSAATRHRLSQQIQIPPQPEAPPPSAPPTSIDPTPETWSFTSYGASMGFNSNWGTTPPTTLSPLVRTPRQHSELEDIVVSPAAWDYASAGYTRPEVSPLTPSYPLPPAPRMVPRNLSMSEMQIRTGYTPQPSRNNSLVPPSPHVGLSPGLLGGSRSLLMGDRSPLPRMVEEPESMTLLNGTPPEMTSAPWRGWTQDNLGRSEAPPRPSIAITRHSSSSTSNPTSMEPELLMTTDASSPWLSSGPGRYTAEPEPSGFGNSLHVPLGLARHQSVTDDIRRRLVTRSRQRLQSAMSPSSPQAAPLASSGPETAMQRANRFANQTFRRREDSLAVPRPGSAAIARVRRPVSIAEERPRTPSTTGPSTQPPGAPLDADNAATSFVRTAAERTGSPSPTRSSGATASQQRSAEERLASVRLRAMRRELARPPSLSRPSLDSVASDSSSSRDSYDRLRRSASSSFRDLMASQRAEIRRSSGFEFMDFQYETLDFPPFMENVIGGGLAAFSPPPPGGLSSEEISALPSSAYKDSEEAKKEERCPICLDDYEETSEVMGVPECNHYFHKGCLSQWLERNRSCPYCRKNIARRSGRRGTGSIGGRHHRPRPGPPPPPPPPPPGSSSSGSTWRSMPPAWVPDPRRQI